MGFFFVIDLLFCFGLIKLLNEVFTAISPFFEEGEISCVSSKERTTVYGTYQSLEVAW